MQNRGYGIKEKEIDASESSQNVKDKKNEGVVVYGAISRINWLKRESAEEDGDEGEGRCKERDKCVQKEVKCIIIWVNCIGNEGVQSCTYPIETDTERQGKWQAGWEVFDAQNMANCVEPTDAATSQQAQYDYLPQKSTNSALYMCFT